MRGDDGRPAAPARRGLFLGCRSRPQPGITLAALKIFVIAVLIAIIVALFAALVFLYRDAGRGKRVVWLLTVRVALSVSLVAFLILSYYMGWIGPGGIGK